MSWEEAPRSLSSANAIPLKVPDFPMACPVCSGDSLKSLHCFTAKQAAEFFVPYQRDDRRHLNLLRNIETLWQGSTCEVVQCDACRFAFPIPSVAGSKEFYELAWGDVKYVRYRWEYDRAIEFLKSMPPPGPLRILELGAGIGQFIKRLLRFRVLSPDQIVATDYTSRSISELCKLGVDAQPAGVFELAAHPANRVAFDAVCAFQVLEHMASATEVVAAVKSMLKQGGLAILSVPHGPMIEFNERHLGCFDMPPNHVGRWYHESFGTLAQKTGLELVAHEIEPWRLLRLLPLLHDVGLARLGGAAASMPGSLAGRARAAKNPRIRHLLSVAVGGVMLLPLLRAVLRLGCGGYAQLAVLRKP